MLVFELFTLYATKLVRISVGKYINPIAFLNILSPEREFSLFVNILTNGYFISITIFQFILPITFGHYPQRIIGSGILQLHFITVEAAKGHIHTIFNLFFFPSRL